MKYFLLIIILLFLTNCTQNKRAGSYYDPQLYHQIQADYDEKSQESVMKIGEPTHQFHSALGQLCRYYKNDTITNEELICSNGNSEKQVRILQ
jgi:hypothetical protein